MSGLLRPRRWSDGLRAMAVTMAAAPNAGQGAVMYKQAAEQ